MPAFFVLINFLCLGVALGLLYHKSVKLMLKSLANCQKLYNKLCIGKNNLPYEHELKDKEDL